MSSISHSFREWLVGEIQAILNRDILPPPSLIWCDPYGEWGKVGDALFLKLATLFSFPVSK